MSFYLSLPGPRTVKLAASTENGARMEASTSGEHAKLVTSSGQCVATLVDGRWVDGLTASEDRNV